MLRYFRSVFVLVLFCASSWARGADLVVHALETGVGKFHRLDNLTHPYASTSAWANYVYPDGLDGRSSLKKKNEDASYTVFFNDLEDLLTQLADIHSGEGRSIDILNIEAHGMPGGMWFPKDQRQRNGFECHAWRDSAYGPDQDNYENYYTATGRDDVMFYRRYAEAPSHAHQSCVTGLEDWAEILPRVTGAREAFSAGAEIHLVSCIVGLGLTGKNFTEGLAKLIFGGKGGQVVSSVNFGLGDWSIPEGMGFWDYQSDQQLARDNAVYPVHRNDREIWQSGAIRFARAFGDGSVGLATVENLLFLDVSTKFPTPKSWGSADPSENEAYLGTSSIRRTLQGVSVRIPGTSAEVDLGR